MFCRLALYLSVCLLLITPAAGADRGDQTVRADHSDDGKTVSSASEAAADDDLNPSESRAVLHQVASQSWNISHPGIEIDYPKSNLAEDPANSAARAFRKILEPDGLINDRRSETEETKDGADDNVSGFILAPDSLDRLNGPWAAAYFANNENAAFGSVPTTRGFSYELSGNIYLYTEGAYLPISGWNLDRNSQGQGFNPFRDNVDGDPEGFNVTAGVRLRF